MKRPRIVLSDAAVADILEQSDWYQEQSGDRLAKRWERAVTSAVLRAVETPGRERYRDVSTVVVHMRLSPAFSFSRTLQDVLADRHERGEIEDIVDS